MQGELPLQITTADGGDRTPRGPVVPAHLCSAGRPSSQGRTAVSHRWSPRAPSPASVTPLEATSPVKRASQPCVPRPWWGALCAPVRRAGGRTPPHPRRARRVSREGLVGVVLPPHTCVRSTWGGSPSGDGWVPVKLHRVFTSFLRIPASARDLEFHRGHPGDSGNVVEPFMQDHS